MIRAVAIAIAIGGGGYALSTPTLPQGRRQLVELQDSIPADVEITTRTREPVFSALGEIWLADSLPRLLYRGVNHVAMDPALSRDRKSIVFVTYSDDGKGHVWRMAIHSGTTPERLTEHGAIYRNPVWSPDGTAVAVVREEETGGTRAGRIAGEALLIPSSGRTGRIRRLGLTRADARATFVAGDIPVWPSFTASPPGHRDTFTVALPNLRDRERVLALEGGMLITMRENEVIRDGVILVRGGQIIAVGKRRDVRVPVGATRIDVRGSTIIPGLIDTRSALTIPQDGFQVTSPELAANLAFGVTSARVFVNSMDELRRLRQLALRLQTGRAVGARLVADLVMTTEAESMRERPEKPSAFEYFAQFEGARAYTDERLRRFGMAHLPDSDWHAPDDYVFHVAARTAHRLSQVGGLIAVGSGGKPPGLSFHWELRALELGGFKPMEILRAATINGAKAMQVEQDLGSLEAGKIADLVIVKGNSLRGAWDRSIEKVMRSGVLYEAATLTTLWPFEFPPPVVRDTGYDAPTVSRPFGDDRTLTPIWRVPIADTTGTAEAASSHDRLPLKASRSITIRTGELSFANLDISPDGQTIVFDVLGDIYAVSIEGGKARQLTRGLAVDRRPVWSPDGSRIAFISDGHGAENLWVMRSDGTEARPVARERHQPVGSVVRPSFTAAEWMRDGSGLVADDTVYTLAGGRVPFAIDPHIGPLRFDSTGRYAYLTRVGPQAALTGLRRYDLHTRTSTQLAHPPVPFHSALASPDGQWVVYATEGQEYNGLRVRNVEQGRDRWLIFPLNKRRFRQERYVFLADSRNLLIAYGGALHRINVDTGADVVIPVALDAKVDLAPLVRNSFRLLNDSVDVRYLRSPSISPDGRSLAFGALQKVYIATLPQGQVRPLLQAFPDGHFQPAYSPDGRSVAFVSWSDREGGHVWRVAANGGTPQRLTAGRGRYHRPAWSPDGKHILVYKSEAGGDRGPEGENAMLQIISAESLSVPRTIMERMSRQHRPTFVGGQLFIQEVSAGQSDSAAAGGREEFVGPLIAVNDRGGNRRAVARVRASGQWNWPIIPSPNGRYLAYRLRENVCVVERPSGGGGDSVLLGGSTSGHAEVCIGHMPLDIDWDREGNTLLWFWANRLRRLDVTCAFAWTSQTGRGPVPVAADSEMILRIGAERRTGKGTTVLRGARIVTMRGDEVIPRGTIVVRDDRIVAIGSTDAVAAGVPRDANVVDVSGKTIIPGLVDAHTHFAWRPDEHFAEQDWRYQTALSYGVTTARELARNATQYGDVELLEVGRMLGPRLVTAGWAIQQMRIRIDSSEDAHDVVQYHKAMGGTVVKQYGLRTRRQRQWVFQSAHRAEINVTSEGDDHLSLFLDGSDVEHAMPEAGLYDDIVALIAASGSWYAPTLMVGYGGAARDHFRREERVYADAKYLQLLPVEERAKRRRGGLRVPGQRTYLDFVEAARAATDIARRGGRIAVGSHGEDQGIGVHWEMWALQMGGLTSHEALRAATLSGAEALGFGQDLGSLEVGKLADLVVLDGNPLAELRYSTQLRFVMKNGELFDGHTLKSVLNASPVSSRRMSQ